MRKQSSSAGSARVSVEGVVEDVLTALSVLRLPDHALTPQRLEVAQALLHYLRSAGECRSAPRRDLGDVARRVAPCWSISPPCRRRVAGRTRIPVPAPRRYCEGDARQG